MKFGCTSRRMEKVALFAIENARALRGVACFAANHLHKHLHRGRPFCRCFCCCCAKRRNSDCDRVQEPRPDETPTWSLVEVLHTATNSCYKLHCAVSLGRCRQFYNSQQNLQSAEMYIIIIVVPCSTGTWKKKSFTSKVDAYIIQI